MSTACTQISFPAPTDEDGGNASGGAGIIARLFGPSPGGSSTWMVRFCVYTATDVSSPEVVIVDTDNGQTISTSSTHSIPPSWVNPDNVIKNGDYYTEVLTFNGAGPWKLKYKPRYQGLRATVVATILGKLVAHRTGQKEGWTHEFSESSSAGLSSAVHRVDKTYTLNDRYDHLSGVIKASYTISGSISFLKTQLSYSTTDYTLEDMTAKTWRYVVFSDTGGLISTGECSVTTSYEQPLIPQPSSLLVPAEGALADLL